MKMPTLPYLQGALLTRAIKGPLDVKLSVMAGITPETTYCKAARPKRLALSSGDIHPTGLLKEYERVNRWVVAH